VGQRQARPTVRSLDQPDDLQTFFFSPQKDWAPPRDTSFRGRPHSIARKGIASSNVPPCQWTGPMILRKCHDAIARQAAPQECNAYGSPTHPGAQSAQLKRRDPQSNLGAHCGDQLTRISPQEPRRNQNSRDMLTLNPAGQLDALVWKTVGQRLSGAYLLDRSVAELPNLVPRLTASQPLHYANVAAC